jgi:hypothetical protein
LFVGIGENQGAGKFTRHSPELGIVQSIFSPATRLWKAGERREKLMAAAVG